MQTVTTIGLDIAKSVFQVHGIDAKGNVVIRRQIKRRQVLAFFQKLPRCLIGIEACATAHHWSRELNQIGAPERECAFDAVDGSSTRHVSAMDVGAVGAPTIRRSQACKRSRQSVSISPNRCSRSTALMPLAG